jgi:hypothetical protein
MSDPSADDEVVEPWEEREPEDYDDMEDDAVDEPVGSCERCGCDVSAEELDGGEELLCDQCQWWRAQADD